MAVGKTEAAISPSVLSIAGFDPGGGAGVIADLKTFSFFGVYGTAVITTLTAQNHKQFSESDPVDPGMVRSQLESVLSGYNIRAVKVGLLTSPQSAEVVCGFLKELNDIPVVVDTVFSASSGKDFITGEMIRIYKEKIFPLSSLITPNIDELSLLTGESIGCEEELIKAAKILFSKTGAPVLAKGGHLKERAVDFLISEIDIVKFESEIIPGINTHGSGCILSSAICANLALGRDLKSSVTFAKEFMNKILRSGSVLEGVGKILDPGLGNLHG